MAQILFGFGGCKFEKSTYNGVALPSTITATFTGGKGLFEFIPYQFRRRKVNGGWANHLKGYDCKAECSYLYNIASTDAAEYQKLVDILNLMIGTNETMTVTPRYDIGITSISYECFLDSSFKPDDVHRVKTGQVAGLSFTTKDMVTSIPRKISDTTESDYWDGTDLYVDDGTDQYIDDL